MKITPFPTIVCGLILLLLVVMAAQISGKDKKSKKSSCSNPHPEQMCTAANQTSVICVGENLDRLC